MQSWLYCVERNTDDDDFLGIGMLEMVEGVVFLIVGIRV